jgi:signal transduction histidine kinase
MMPGMSGLEVCSRIKGDGMTRFIPVVIVTSLDQKSDKINAIKEGADDFITKPVDKTELLVRVRSLLKIKSLHDQLEKKYQEVLKLQSLKDNLMHMLVHDFRNPLTGLMGYLDIMELKIKKNENPEIESSISKSQLLATRMGALISDIMDIARLEENKLPLHLEQVSLREVMEGCLKEFEHAVEVKKITAAIEESTPGISVTGDRILLHRTIGNILANALRYSPINGSIRLSISTDAGMALLSIADEGPGIPLSALDKVFDKFYQVDKKAADARSGAGLGLAFCNLVVKAHRGGITVENNPGKGCRFTISLPL